MRPCPLSSRPPSRATPGGLQNRHDRGIDRFGQYMHKDWPGKAHSEDDPVQRRTQEAADLTAHPGPKGWSQ